MDKYSITDKLSTHVWSGIHRATNESVMICRSVVDTSTAFDRASSLMSAHKDGTIAAKEFFLSQEASGNVLYAIVPNSLETVQDLLSDPPSHSNALSLVSSLFSSLSNIHSHNLVHTDIRPDTLAIVNNRVLLSPVSLSPRSPTLRPPRHLAYLPPEQLLPNPKTNTYPEFDFSTDVWSAAIVVLQLFKVGSLSSPLFAAPGVAEQIAKIFKCLGLPAPSDLISLPIEAARHLVASVKPSAPPLLPRLLLAQKLPSSSVGFFQGLLMFSPIKRMTCDDALKSEFLSGAEIGHKTRDVLRFSTGPSLSLPPRPYFKSVSKSIPQSKSVSREKSSSREKSVSTEPYSSHQPINQIYLPEQTHRRSASVSSSIAEDEASELIGFFNSNYSPPKPSASPVSVHLSPSPVSSPSISDEDQSELIEDSDYYLETTEDEPVVDASELIEELLKLADKIEKSKTKSKKRHHFHDFSEEESPVPCSSPEKSISPEDSPAFSDLSVHSLSFSCDNALNIFVTEIKNFNFHYFSSRSFFSDVSNVKASLVVSVFREESQKSQIFSKVSTPFQFKSNLLSDRLSSDCDFATNFGITTSQLMDDLQNLKLNLKLIFNDIVIAEARVPLDTLLYIRSGLDGWYNFYPPETTKSTAVGQVHCVVKLNNSLVSSVAPDAPQSPINFDGDFKPFSFEIPNFDSASVSPVATNDFVSQYLCDTIS
ncbi:hypothetical protein GEMRC1_011741 [Eukaryota sp. GEM-RC1]